MINLKDIYTGLAPVLRQKVSDTAIPILVSEQTNPNYPNYVTYRLINWTQLGHGYSDWEDPEDENSEAYDTESLWSVTLRLVFIGVKSEQLALEFGHHFNKVSYQMSFENLGLYYNLHTGIRPTPRAVADGWEQRHMLDVKFNIVIKDSEELEFFDIVEITQEIENEAGDLLLTRTDEIDI